MGQPNLRAWGMFFDILPFSSFAIETGSIFRLAIYPWSHRFGFSMSMKTNIIE